MRLLSFGVICVLLAMASSDLLRSQDPPATQAPQDQYFAGIVTALSDTSVTITRTVLGKSTVRSFTITDKTVIQGGKPKLKTKVTVKWIPGDDGDCAVKIILRGSVPPPKKQ
ncbi:MAG: hypothetical protein ABSH50_10620 [Bryobacteraceae bacterium]